MMNGAATVVALGIRPMSRNISAIMPKPRIWMGRRPVLSSDLLQYSLMIVAETG